MFLGIVIAIKKIINLEFGLGIEVFN